MNTLLAVIDQAFGWVWATSLDAALLAALVFLVQKILGRWLTPRWRYFFSLLILFRLLVPVAPSSSLSLHNLFRSRIPSSSLAGPAAPAASREQDEGTRVAGPPHRPSSGISPHAPPFADGFSARHCLGLVWACGFLTLIALGVLRYRQWARFMEQGQPVKNPLLLELLDNARAEMGVRRPVTLLAVRQLGSPAVFGLRRICLIVPASAMEQLSAGELRMVFLHEMAHVRQHDVCLNFLLIAVQFLHWFNPLVWMASHRIRADRELVRDAMALSRLPAAEHTHYGRVLLKLMEAFSAETPVFAGAVPVVSGQQEIKRRLTMIKQNKRGSFVGNLAAAVVVAALVCGTFTRAGENSSKSGAWTCWNNGQPIGSFFAVAGSARETVAVGVDGLIATRNNSTGVWTTQVFAGDPDFRAIVYTNNQYVIVREAGMIMTSLDGVKWTSRQSPTKKNLMGLYWDGHQYLAGGDGGMILASANGVDWTNRDSGSKISFYSFSYSGARYVAVGNDGIRISDDSVTWFMPRNVPSNVPFTACTWTGDEFLACGLGLGKFPTIYTSPDGNVWTLRDHSITASLRAATTVNGVIYIAGDSLIAKSTDDGATWKDTYDNKGPNKLFMGLASDGDYLLAAGFNHNVWAMPLSGSAAAK